MKNIITLVLCSILFGCNYTTKPNSPNLNQNSSINECFKSWGTTNSTNFITKTNKSFRGKVFIGGLSNTDKPKGIQKSIRAPSNFEAPDIIDNSFYVSYVQNQGQLPECATRSEASILDASYWKQNNVKCETDAHRLYFSAKEIDNNSQSGTNPESVIEALKSKSFIKTGEIPKITTGIILSTKDLPFAIHKYGFVWVGLSITDSWYDPDESGRIKDGGNFIGGHQVVVVGYSKPCNLIKILNSWGDDYGDKGYCYLTFEEFESELIYGTTQIIEW